MTASDNKDDSVGRVDRERNFLHLQVYAPSAVQQDEMEARRHFGRLGDPGEIRFGPWTAKAQRVGWPAVKISHIRCKRLVASVERAWHGRAEHAEVFLRR